MLSAVLHSTYIFAVFGPNVQVGVKITSVSQKHLICSWDTARKVCTELLLVLIFNTLHFKGVVDWFFSRLDCVYGVQSNMCSCFDFK